MYLILVAVVIVLGVGLVLWRRTVREELLTRDLGTELGALADRLKLEVQVLDGEQQRSTIDRLLTGSRLHRPAETGEVRIDRVIQGPLDSYPVTLFDVRNGKTGKNAFTALVLRSLATRLPGFQLEATGIDGELPRLEGLRRLEPEDCILFNESFRLEVRDDDRERLEALLRGPAMEFFDARLEARLVVESLGDRLLIYEADRVLTASQSETLLRQSTELADALTGRVRPPPEPPPEPQPPPTGLPGG
jgi:hypothetical protein